MANHIELGRMGEDAAAEHYVRLGYAVVARNWRSGRGELDLIVARGDLVVICEVKTRRVDGRFGLPADAVGHDKQRRVRALAAAWLAERDGPAVDVRFDVASVTTDGHGLRVDLTEAAF